MLEEQLEELDIIQSFSKKDAERNRVRSRATDLLDARGEYLKCQDTLQSRTGPGSAPDPDEEVEFFVRQQPRGKEILSKRAMILEEIQDKLSKYDELLVKARELAGFRRPTPREQKNLESWFSLQNPLSYECEELYVTLKSDLITLKPPVKESGPLDEWVEVAVARLPKRVRKVSIS